MHKRIGVLLIIFNSFLLAAQSDSINFTFKSNSVTTSGETFDTNSIFTKNGNVLEWVQEKKGVIDAIKFSIVSTSGGWDATTSQGNIVYTMVFEDYECVYTITNNNSNISAVLIIGLNGQEAYKYMFTKGTISY